MKAQGWTESVGKSVWYTDIPPVFEEKSLHKKFLTDNVSDETLSIKTSGKLTRLVIGKPNSIIIDDNER